MKHYIIVLMAAIASLLAISSCSNSENRISEHDIALSDSKIEDVVKAHFDEQNWKYHMYTDEDSIITFEMGFTVDNDKLDVRVCIDPDDLYQIICNTKTELPPAVIDKGIIAMNDYNVSSRVVSGCVTPKGKIVFWIGRNIDGNAFSEQAFAADFAMVLQETEDATSKIFKQIYATSGPDK